MKGKRKRIVMAAAFGASLALLAGGIVSAAVLGRGENAEALEKPEKEEQQSLTIEQGDITPTVLEKGGFCLASGEFCLELYDTGEGFGTRITDESGGVKARQLHPITIRIKKPNAEEDYLGMNVETEDVAANYDTVRAEGNAVVAEGEAVSPGGSIFAVTDQYIGRNAGGFELIRDIRVKQAGKEDEAFNSIVSFQEKEAKAWDAYEYFIPATVFRDSGHLLPGAVGSDLSQDYVWLRDSHMGLPMVMARNKQSGFALALGRIIEGKVTSGIDESQGSWVVSKNLDYGSLGISNHEGTVSLDICYPGMEGNITYLDSSLQFLRRSHPVREDVVHAYKVLLQPNQSADFTDAMVQTYQAQFGANQIPQVEADLDQVYDVTLELFSDFTQEYAYGKTGMPFALDLDGTVSSLDSLIGFVGQQTSVGFHLIRNGILTGSQEQRKKGEDVINTWVRDGFTEYGFPRVWFVTASYEWAPTSFVLSYVRYMSDGMEGILDAYLEEQADGVEKKEWLDRCRGYADWLVSAQHADGSWARAYNPDTGEVSAGEDGKIGNDTNNTACSVRYLVRMYEQTGKEDYLYAAKKAGEYVYDHSYRTDTYYGGTPDGQNVIDKEAGVMALYAFDSLYQATGEEKWLDAAQHAAVFTASFIYTFDFTVWGKEPYNIYRDLVGTSGISRISTGNSAVDPFSAYLYYEYFKLYVYTGNTFYYEFAKLLQDNTKQFLCMDGSLPYGRDGLVNEAHVISNMLYGNDVEACLTWCNIAMIDPIASMEDAFGVKSIQEAKELGQEKLRERLEQYGAGGRFR